MKPKLFAVSTAIILLTSATSNAGNGYFLELGRNVGYGISDGYHAQRHCLTDGKSCNNCSSVQQPMMPQPMMPQPMMPQPMMPQPMMAPAYSQWAPPAHQQAGYPVGQPAAPINQPWYQPVAPGYGQAAMPAVASPQRRAAWHW